MTSLKKTPAAIAAEQVDSTGLVAHTGVSMRRDATLQQITGNGVKENGRAEERQARFIRPWANPTQLARPSYLLNFPFSYATQFANNPWMEDLSPDRRQPDFRRAAVQFLELYRYMAAAGALVYVLPTPLGADLQDLMYTANLGIVLEHLPNQNTVVISNFASPPVGVRRSSESTSSRAWATRSTSRRRSSKGKRSSSTFTTTCMWGVRDPVRERDVRLDGAELRHAHRPGPAH
jgi:hypothetical protein